MPLATVFISSSGAVRPWATNWVISRVAITENTVMKRSSVSVRTATISRPVVMKTETTTRVPSLALTEKGRIPVPSAPPVPKPDSLARSYSRRSCSCP